MVALPAEIYSQIFNFLPQPTVKDCRLLNKHVGCTTTTLAFRHMRLQAEEDASRFVKVALSDSLRSLVREVTIDRADWLACLCWPSEWSGRAEELYLDDCPILWGARTISPLDESTATFSSPEGDAIDIPNEG
jgi:hypothetical protein